MSSDITLDQLRTFGFELKKIHKIGDWKNKVREFKKIHDLTDREAIMIANKARKGVYES